MESLRALVRGFPSVLLGYSGGVDSALLAVVVRQELGKDRMLAAIGRSASYPEAQWQTAVEVAARFDIPLVEIPTHELEDANYLANPTNRCFYCKTELWNRLVPLARERGLAIVCDGTNADDLREHRPGKAAGVKAGVRSPLAEVGLTKAEIRAASRELGLPTWDAPAAPCLSSRVQYGLTITPAHLRQVEKVEETREPELRAALKHVAGRRSEPRPLTLQITGFGVFPDYHRPYVLWAGITPEPGLELLQHEVEQAFAPLGFPTEARAFRPHVTLARTARDARPRDFKGLDEILAGTDFDATITVAEVDLMQSTLQKDGPVYQVRYHERLS